VICSYLSLAAFWNHDTKAPHFCSSSSPFQHKEMQMIYPGEGSWWQSQHNTQQLQRSSRWSFKIPWRASSATIQNSNWQAAIKGFLHINTWKSLVSNSVNCYVGPTTTSWGSWDLDRLAGGGWMWACTAGTHKGNRLNIKTNQFAR